MSRKVVDASAILAVLLDEPESELVSRRLDGHDLAAPLLLVFEVLNTCAVKTKKYPAKRDTFVRALQAFRRFDVFLEEIDPEEVFDLALRHKLTGYDASYLWLSKQMDAELVTLDAELIAAIAAP
jgi:predicted nucleic acid-binding protein